MHATTQTTHDLTANRHDVAPETSNTWSPKAGRAMLMLIAAMLMTLGTTGQAQAAEDRDEAVGMVGAVCQTVYAFAWPTAEYTDARLRRVVEVKNGFNVIVRLRGKSAFSGGTLWLDLQFEVRDGGFSGLRVRGHNAILADPFETVETLGEVLVAIVDEVNSQSVKR